MSAIATDPAPTAPPPDFPLIARASNTVRNKNLLIIAMCVLCAVWFAYDGFIGWPQRNDRLVTSMIEESKTPTSRIKTEDLPTIEAWPTWAQADTTQHQLMADVAKRNGRDEFKSETDILVQKLIVLGLALASAASIWWFQHCQARRAIAEAATVSPSPGVIIPWTSITIVDNTRWKKTGIVDITYQEAPGGRPAKAKFDDYELDREPLLLILDQLAERAVNAEFLPKEEPPATSPTA
jgi:hypothetical protein